MQKGIIIDTGVLVAFLMSRDKFHDWAVNSLTNIEYPLLTCEAVLTEVCFLLQRVHSGSNKALQLVKQGYIDVSFCLDQEIEAVEMLMQRYESVPMSLADACLVRMSEIYPNSSILTLDSDFTIYRKNRHQIIPLIMPDF
ncbi:PIN domain-containing protein [Sphaerospermopsis sp. LEGE 08334]|uniref:type II toxin-antitoxin system VapC family toxin n=1 Tax=Sphaerospermopsis sp. LEGE 08334 TaxID=1828651 RepID=UPI00188231A8|nr:PIN domain-containing protein [Sphaerospermopsis sp. LEGE 08334]MBE9055800.1 PIN domain-containing protein [Sphaerospermopsis sp. LEGE 08334]